MDVRNVILFLLLLLQSTSTRADVVLTTAGQEKTFRHESLSYQLFDKVGLGPGSSVGPLPVGIWDKRDEEHLCEITDQTFYSPLEEIMEIPVDKYRELRKNQIVIYPNPFAVVNCSKVQRSLLVVWTLPILIRFWDAHFLFVTSKNSTVNPFLSRSIVENQFNSEYYSQASKAYLVTTASDEILAFLAEVQENYDQTLSNCSASIDQVDYNPLLLILDSVPFRLLFQVVFPIGFLSGAMYSLWVFRVRQKDKLMYTPPCIFRVLAISIFISIASAIFLAIEGYASRGLMNAEWQHSFRPMFFGLNSAADFLVGAFWLRVVRESSIRRNVVSKCVERVNVSISILLVSLDVFIFAGFVYLNVPWPLLYVVVPSVLVFFQVSNICFLLWSTRKILRLIRTATLSKGEAPVQRAQRALMRRLAFWIRVSSACSGVFVLCLFCIALQTFYFDVAAYVIINTAMVVARLGGIIAKAKFCSPPPKVKVQPSSVLSPTCEPAAVS